MQTLREALEEAKSKKIALGHFNISNLEGLKAIALAAKEKNVPILIGLSEGERTFVGITMARAMVSAISKELSQSLFLNADHTHSVEAAKLAIDAGFDEILFDGSSLGRDQNIESTKEVIKYAKSSGRDILIEGELGYIGSSSTIHDAIPAGAAITPELLTTAEDAKQFTDETGIDLIAPAVGNVHGMFKDGTDPALAIDRIKEISEAVRASLVLHGASGNTADDVRAAIAAGVRIVHVNTELRAAYRNALDKSLKDQPNEVTPYKLMKPAVEAMKQLVIEKLTIFNTL